MNELTKQFAALFSGSFISQGILFGITLILTRLYSEELFGIFTLYSTITVVLQTIATMRFELAILLPDNNSDAAALVFLNFGIISIVSVVLLLISIIFNSQICLLLDSVAIGQYLYFVPLSVFLSGMYEALSYWHNRQKRFNQIAMSKIVKSIATGSLQWGVAYTPLKFSGLVYGVVVGQLMSTVYLYIISFRSLQKYSRNINFEQIQHLALIYKDIPIFNTLISFINNFSNQLPVLLISRYFGLVATGNFGLANRAIRTPLDLVSQSVGQVFFNRASEIVNNKGNVFVLMKKTYKWLTITSIIPFAILYFLTFHFDIIFGVEWLEAGKYTRILMPFLFVGFINNSVSSIIVILNTQRSILYREILQLIFSFLSLSAG